MKLFITFFTGICLLWVLVGCTESIEDFSRVDETRYDAAYAVPLIDSEVTLNELIGDVSEEISLTVDPDGLLRFRYSGEVPAVGSDIVFARLESIAQGVFVPITRSPQAAPFGGGADIDIDEVRIKGGLLNYSLPNGYDRPVTVTLSIPDARLDGVPFSVSADLPAYSGEGTPPTFQNRDTPVNLSGYVLTIPNDSLYFEYSIVGENGEDLAPSAQTVVSFTNLRFSYVEGYLGQELYPGLRDTVEVDFFDRYLEGEVFFEDPTITMTLTNTFGLPALAQVSVLNVVDVNGNVIPITGTAVEEGFYFNFPTIPGDTAITTFVFDNSNSNISEVLSARPVALDYEVNALINPDGDTDIIGFLTDTAAYSARVDVELPLYGQASGFVLRDTFPIDLMDRFGEVVGVDFRLTTRNGIPLSVSVEGTFLDENDNALADLTDGRIQLLDAAPIGAAGNVLNGGEPLINDVTFEDDRLDAIRSADRLVVALNFSTTGQGDVSVRVTNEQKLQVLLGAIVRVENR
ncbi:hypothetical protein FUA23_10265 [Neolewinella aurantiaca]|uniref:Uncharacterized protein n=1 Tax=Neolewinella aurantiaca TaxID=2602767 RepID=A0A5C7FT02_9BACT|nr:hypothetical protein [Neolewinella aurantiaca]TXF89575.1 hypothetical protein FUA23_10265 [Neolewinella aurantiaca]